MLRESAVKETDFNDLYGAERVENDLARVRELDEKFNTEAAQNASIREQVVWGHSLEAFLHRQIGQQGFLGEGAVGIKTSKFDDYVNGVDEVVIYPRPDGVSHLGLSVDFTFGNPAKKIDRVVQRVRAGEMGRIKYFKADVPGFQFRGEMRTPKVVVAVSRESIRDALALWVQGEDDRLKNHPLQMLMLRQIADQLDVYGGLAPAGIKGQYNAAAQVVNGVLSEKRAAGLAMGSLRNDRVHTLLGQKLGELLKMSPGN